MIYHRRQQLAFLVSSKTRRSDGKEYRRRQFAMANVVMVSTAAGASGGGFAHAANQGAARAQDDIRHQLLLNPDLSASAALRPHPSPASPQQSPLSRSPPRPPLPSTPGPVAADCHRRPRAPYSHAGLLRNASSLHLTLPRPSSPTSLHPSKPPSLTPGN